jgi:translocation and assembly module TamB
MRDTGRLNVLVPKKKDTVKRHKLAAGSDINVNITVDKNAQFTLIIDKASGDFLSVKGDASINAAITPGGAITLNGSYELHSGTYQLNYNFVKRKFAIKDGSTISFGGDPVKGTDLDVTAVYTARIPPFDLVENEVTDQSQLNYYKQSLPFNVDLYMKGQVLTPSLTFDVELPENGVYPISADQVELIQGKLQQVRADTADLNKQVFAALVLGRFVSDDPFTSGASSTYSNMALQSVSTFIGEQLNQAAGKLVKGVDISA